MKSIHATPKILFWCQNRLAYFRFGFFRCKASFRVEILFESSKSFIRGKPICRPIKTCRLENLLNTLFRLFLFLLSYLVFFQFFTFKSAVFCATHSGYERPFSHYQKKHVSFLNFNDVFQLSRPAYSEILQETTQLRLPHSAHRPLSSLR